MQDFIKKHLSGYKKSLIAHQKKVALILAIIILCLFTFVLILSRPPEFPDDIPSAETFEVANYSEEQKAFFDDYTKYIRDGYGEMIIAEDLNYRNGTDNFSDELPALFRHQYQSFNKRQVFDLTDAFAKSRKTAYKISSNNRNGDNGGSSQYYNVEFLKNGAVWIIVEMEMFGEQAKEYPTKKTGAQIQDVESVDKDQPVFAPVGDARLAIVIDDLGTRLDVMRKLISLQYDITYSILPQQQFSLESAEMAFDNGRDVILHLPMEPKEYPKYNPGLGALLISDKPETIIEKMEQDLETVPYAVGVNNHMGSAFTQYDEGLDIVMQVLSGRLLFFLDSKTAPGRIAKNSAKDYGVPYLSRNIFLDNVLEEEAIRRQLHKAARIAIKRGKAIAIGHPHMETYQALLKRLPEIEAQGVRISRISDLLD